MKKKTFEISMIQNGDDINALSLALNEKEQVTHLKIGKDHITFSCLDIEPLLSVIQKIDKNLVVKEVIDGKKREYDFDNREDREHYFMLRNIMSDDDIDVLVERLTQDDRYHDVHYDQANRLLVLTSSQKDVLSLVRKELFKINPSVEVYEHRKPIRSQDVFNQKYLMSYIRLSLLCVFFALALITSKDDTILTPIMWMLTALLLGELTIKRAFKNIKQLKFFVSENLMLVALVLGIVSQAYVETCIAIIVYQLSSFVMSKSLEKAFKRIDDTVKMPEKGIRLNGDKEEDISLYEFEKGDVLVVYPHQTIHIPGVIIKGDSQLNTYSNTSLYELTHVSEGNHVHSGDINVGEEPLYIRIETTYNSSHFVELMQIASLAPVYESKLEKMGHLLAKLYTPIVIVIGIVLGVVLPLVSFDDYGAFLHVGALLMALAIPLSSEQSTSISVLSGFAKAFSSGIIVESSFGLDAMNTVQTIVYDRFDGVEVTQEELNLFKRLSHMGRILVIFNDGPVALENDQYTMYNDLTVEEKLEVMDGLVGPVAYIGDSFKDIALLQKSSVGISRGGLLDSKVVENSDIVLIDSALDKVYDVFVIARNMRSIAVLNQLLTFFVKIALFILVLSFTSFPLWVVVLCDILLSAIVLRISTLILR